MELSGVWVVSPPVCGTGLSLMAKGCLIGATPRAQQAERAADGGVVYVSRALSVSPRTPGITAQRVAQCDPSNTRNCLPPKQLRREIQ